MSGNTDYGVLLRKFRKAMRGAPIIDDDDWKEANKRFVSDLKDSIKTIKFSQFTNEEKINEYKLIQEFIDESISEISEVLQGNSLMAPKLTSNMARNLSGVYKSLVKNINALKPTVETAATAAPEAVVRIMTPVSEEVPPDRMTQDTNIKTGGGISGFVGRIREMITPRERIQSNAIIPEATNITPKQSKNKEIAVASDEPVDEEITGFAYATPVQPTTEMRSGRFIRSGRTQVNNLITRGGGGGGGGGGGNTPPENYLGGFI